MLLPRYTQKVTCLCETLPQRFHTFPSCVQTFLCRAQMWGDLLKPPALIVFMCYLFVCFSSILHQSAVWYKTQLKVLRARLIRALCHLLVRFCKSFLAFVSSSPGQRLCKVWYIAWGVGVTCTDSINRQQSVFLERGGTVWKWTQQEVKEEAVERHMAYRKPGLDEKPRLRWTAHTSEQQGSLRRTKGKRRIP